MVGEQDQQQHQTNDDGQDVPIVAGEDEGDRPADRGQRQRPGIDAVLDVRCRCGALVVGCHH
ncbi:hypothetical protein A7U43_15345 [Mycobacterium adipatum]|uniref:Uncharacterized protein n=2 Tax=Mycobacterium adipatum TaxID=1682113 RepID=A0A172UN39_9MYCO|nr:hypothetical protein A7U43_15345 [Mycobacterium adipatum]